MTQFERKSFTVAPSAAKSPAECKHGWVDAKRGRCVLCGEQSSWTTYTHTNKSFGPLLIDVDIQPTRRPHGDASVSAAPCSDFSKPEDWGQ